MSTGDVVPEDCSKICPGSKEKAEDENSTRELLLSVPKTHTHRHTHTHKKKKKIHAMRKKTSISPNTKVNHKIKKRVLVANQESAGATD